MANRSSEISEITVKGNRKGVSRRKLGKRLMKEDIRARGINEANVRQETVKIKNTCS